MYIGYPTVPQLLLYVVMIAAAKGAVRWLRSIGRENAPGISLATPEIQNETLRNHFRARPVSRLHEMANDPSLSADARAMANDELRRRTAG